MNEITGQTTAIVTGASRGIGKQIAKELARRGCKKLVLIALEEDELKNAKEEIQQVQRQKVGWPKLFACDLTEDSAIDDIQRSLGNQGITVDILVNNAGIGSFGKFVNSKQVETLCELNAGVPVLLMDTFLPKMEERGHGMVLNVGSVASFIAIPKMANYAGSKAYVRSLTDSLWYEQQGTGVTVTGLYPGETDTSLNEQMGSEHTRLYQWSPLLSPKFVAESGIQAMLDGKREEIPGVFNKMLLVLNWLLPRRASLAVASWLNQPADSKKSTTNEQRESQPGKP